MDANIPARRLSFVVGEKSLDLMTYSPIADDSLKTRHIDYEQDAPSARAALESIVYDTPGMLDEYTRVDCLIDTRRQVVISADDADSADARATRLLTMLYPADIDRLSIITHRLSPQAWLAMAMDKDTEGFLRRTFENITINHRLTPLCLYLGHRTRFGNSGRLHIHLHDSRLDILAFQAASPIMVNTLAADDDDDALFYTLAAAQAIKFDPTCDRLYISGDSTRRESLAEKLTARLAHPMPLIYPSEMLRAGRLSLNAPLELITLPLCEL